VLYFNTVKCLWTPQLCLDTESAHYTDAGNSRTCCLSRGRNVSTFMPLTRLCVHCSKDLGPLISASALQAWLGEFLRLQATIDRTDYFGKSYCMTLGWSVVSPNFRVAYCGTV